MLRAKEVRSLLFDWGRDWRKGSEPEILNHFFCTMVEGEDFNQLCEKTLVSLSRQKYENLFFSLGPIQVAAVIASLFILHPSASNKNAARKVIEVIKKIMNEKDDDQDVRFHHGCIIGLLLATIQLSELGDNSDILESSLWGLIIRASEKADFQTQLGYIFSYGGKLSELFGQYIRTQPGVEMADKTREETDSLRWKHLRRAAADLPKLTKRHASFPTQGATRAIINEILYKIFGGVDYADRISMVAWHLKQWDKNGQ